MKTFSVYEGMSKEYFDIWTKRFEKVTPSHDQHPREDFFAISEKHPIYVVADGVTLKRDAEGNYPIPSGAFDAARIFCEKVIQAADTLYDVFSESDLKKVFEAGNAAVKELNDSHGIVEGKLNFRDFDYFSATTAFALIKDGALYWWTMHDCGIEAVDASGAVTFHSPKVIPNKERFFTDGGGMSETELNKAIRRTYRNAATQGGDAVGYGVVTGEESSLPYLRSGMHRLEGDAAVLLYSDGFENYVKLDEFLLLCSGLNDDFREKLKFMSDEMIKESPALYGQERSLVVIKPN